jgi:hypothetical protein
MFHGKHVIERVEFLDEENRLMVVSEFGSEPKSDVGFDCVYERELVLIVYKLIG